MESPLVSFIVVSYNHSEFITECLDSIKNQTYKNWELIVADDASKDKSAETAKNWLQENNVSAKTNFHTENKGFATTLNECLEMTEGKYVNIIAADDYFHPEFLEKSLSTLENKGEKFAVVFSAAFIVNQDKTITDYYANLDFYQNENQFRNILKKRNYVSTLTALVRKSAITETGLYDKNILLEDYDRWLRINEKYFFALVPDKLAYYRQHGNNISTIRERQVFVEEILLRIKYDTSLENKSELNNSIKKIYFSSTNKTELNIVYQKYKPYKGKEPWLNFCLKYKISPKIYKLKYRFLK
jgi:alpha-1,3-rhamnosyltransferase